MKKLIVLMLIGIILVSGCIGRQRACSEYKEEEVCIKYEEQECDCVLSYIVKINPKYWSNESTLNISLQLTDSCYGKDIDISAQNDSSIELGKYELITNELGLEPCMVCIEKEERMVCKKWI